MDEHANRETHSEEEPRAEDGGGGPGQDDESPFKRGMNRGMGFLSAFKEAIEETITEARERGDVSSERAKDIMRGALDRAQEAAGQAKDRLEWVPRRDFEELEERVRALETHLGMASSEPEPEGNGATDADSGGEPAAS